LVAQYRDWSELQIKPIIQQAQLLKETGGKLLPELYAF
jgi:hypothetical protein